MFLNCVEDDSLLGIVDRRLAGKETRCNKVPRDVQMRIPDDVLKCAVLIGKETASVGETIALAAVGTGFVVGKSDSENPHQSRSFLVTARHVIAGISPDTAVVRFNDKSGNASAVRILDGWFFHPDSTVDVAVIPFLPKDRELKYVPDTMCVRREDISSRGIGPGDQVFIIGTFPSLAGKKRNQPIARMGHISSIPDDPVATTSGMMDAYCVEAMVTGGLSGSPVFVRETAVHGNLISAGKLHCLGLVHGHWISPSRASIGNIHAGLSIVVPASRIIECIDLALVEKRPLTLG